MSTVVHSRSLPGRSATTGIARPLLCALIVLVLAGVVALAVALPVARPVRHVASRSLRSPVSVEVGVHARR